MVNCPKCQTQNPDEAKFCKKCRAILGKVEVEKNRCPNGHILDPSWGGICPHCKPNAGAPPSPQRPRTVAEGGSPINRGAFPGGISDPPRRKTKVEGDGPVRPEVNPDKRPRGKTQIMHMDDEGKPVTADKRRLVGFLVSFSNRPEGFFFEIREGRHVIGSGADADIRISDDPMMSSQHAILLYRRGKFMFQDNLSTNGSFINGEEVNGNVELYNYDMISMGNTEFCLIMVDPQISSE